MKNFYDLKLSDLNRSGKYNYHYSSSEMNWLLRYRVRIYKSGGCWRYQFIYKYFDYDCKASDACLTAEQALSTLQKYFKRDLALLLKEVNSLEQLSLF